MIKSNIENTVLVDAHNLKYFNYIKFNGFLNPHFQIWVALASDGSMKTH